MLCHYCLKIVYKRLYLSFTFQLLHCVVKLLVSVGVEEALGFENSSDVGLETA